MILHMPWNELVYSQEAVNNMSHQLNQVLKHHNNMVNTGKFYDDVGAKQKLNEFQRMGNAPLWFEESFDVVPTQLTLKSSRFDEKISVSLGNLQHQYQPTNKVDEFAAMQTLYLLNRFGVLDVLFTNSLRLATLWLLYSHVYFSCVGISYRAV